MMPRDRPFWGDPGVKQTVNGCLTVQLHGVPVYDCTVASRDLRQSSGRCSRLPQGMVRLKSWGVEGMNRPKVAAKS
ncbi:MAG: hypothetical protein ACRC8Y_03560 [Chroococcales cyanobacterium]